MASVKFIYSQIHIQKDSDPKFVTNALKMCRTSWDLKLFFKNNYLTIPLYFPGFIDILLTLFISNSYFIPFKPYN